MQNGFPIDQVLDAVHTGKEPPQDERQWIVIEIVNGNAVWTIHNVSLRDTFTFMNLCALDVRDEMRRVENTHAH
jgi:hypothetical protein